MAASVVALATALALAIAVILVAQTSGGLASRVGRLGVSFRITQASALPAEASAADIAARVDPGLVNINVVNASTGFKGFATGMVLTADGIVLTNNHVIRGATSITATDVGNGRTYTGTVVGYALSRDVAVIRLQGASGLQTVPLGRSSALRIGGKVTALGNAGGLGGTPRAATGYVTAVQRTIVATDGEGHVEVFTGLIETNAAILPGDSGGALVNGAGQVVGMNCASNATSDDLGLLSTQSFVIPIDTAVAIVRQIDAGPTAPGVHVGPTAFLGVVPSSSNASFGSAAQQPLGLPLAAVLPGFPAARAGLAQGYLITTINGRPVTSANGLADVLSAYHPGDSIHVHWIDSLGQPDSATVRLALGPPA